MDGSWRSYVWDGENRLVQMTTAPAAALARVPKQRLVFAYDYRGRRISKKTESYQEETASWALTGELRFIYDGWNLISEVQMKGDAADAPNPGADQGGVLVRRGYRVRSYVWGPDLRKRCQAYSALSKKISCGKNSMPNSKMNYLIKYSIFILIACFSSCEKTPEIDKIQRSDTIKLSDNVYLHRTSGKTVTITDKEGFGIINGCIIKLGDNPAAPNSILVEYESFKKGATSSTPNAGLFASVDLSTAIVTHISELSASLKSNLRDVDYYLPH